MSDYEVIKNELCDLCVKTFDISFESAENNLNAPICTFIGNPNAIAFLYFILEISCKFHVVLSKDMIENCTKRSLKDYIDELLACR